MDLPSRHLAEINAPVESLDGWDGSIASLDRDGVLNIGREDYVKNVDELICSEIRLADAFILCQLNGFC